MCREEPVLPAAGDTVPGRHYCHISPGVPHPGSGVQYALQSEGCSLWTLQLKLSWSLCATNCRATVKTSRWLPHLQPQAWALSAITVTIWDVAHV